MYSAEPLATRRTLANVKSSATTPRQPSVPNLIWSATLSRLKVAGLTRSLERVDDPLHVLCSRARNHENSILGVDDDHVLEPDRGHQPAIAQDQAPMRVHQHRFTLHRVSAGVGVNPIAELRPVSDVGPLEVAGHEQQAVRLLHDRPVDYVERQPLVAPRREVLVAGLWRGEHTSQRGKTPGRVLAELLRKHRQPPAFTNRLARAASGFSMNRFTRTAPAVARPGAWM